MIKRLFYAGVFVVAVLFVMQSKGMWERLRQWFTWQDQQGQYREELSSEADWELVDTTPAEKLVNELQERLGTIKQKVSSIQAVKGALSEQQKEKLTAIKQELADVKQELTPASEEANLLFARMDPNFADDVKKTIENNFEKIELAPEGVYAYLYPDQAVDPAAYSYEDVTNTIQSKLSDASQEKDKKIVRQIDYLFRTAAGKEQFDAYLNDTLDSLRIADDQGGQWVTDLYQKIEDIKMELAELESSINRLMRKQ